MSKFYYLLADRWSNRRVRIFMLLISLALLSVEPDRVAGQQENFILPGSTASSAVTPTIRTVAPPLASSSTIDAETVGRLAFHTYTDRDGLPQNSILAMTFDQKGYLWIGTQDGAAYYNGRNWMIVNMPNRQLSNYVCALLAAADESIWFATNGNGVAQLKDGKWTTYDTSAGLPSNQVRSLLETTSLDGRHTLWVGTDGGLARFQDNRWTTIQTGLPNNSVRALLETTNQDGSHALWVGTNGGGLARFQQDQWTIYNSSSGLPNNVVFQMVETVANDGARAVWVDTQGGLAWFQQDRWTIYDTSAGLPNNSVRSLLASTNQDGSRALWVGTGGGGLARFQDNRWTTFNTAAGLPDNSIWSLLEATSVDGRARTLWVGTAGGGLARLEQGKWVGFDQSVGLVNNIVVSLLETSDRDGNRQIWVGTDGGLAKLANGRWTSYDTAAGLPNSTVYSLVETKSPAGKSVLWAGTYGGGLAKFEDNRWSSFDTSAGLPNNIVRTILATSSPEGKQLLWVGTYGGGLARLALGQNNGQTTIEQWTTIDTRAGLPSNWINSILETVTEDGKRALWVGTEGGLARFYDNRWEVFNTSTGLPNNMVRSLLETVSDGRRVLWVGTSGGAARIKLTAEDLAAHRWQILSDNSLPALPNNVVYQIREDLQHRIYLCTNKGVARLTPRIATIDNPAEFSLQTFTTEDGLPSNECDQGASIVDSNGRIWVGTVAGVACFDPKQEIEDLNVKPLYFEKAQIAGLTSEAPRTISPDETLSYRENHVIFEYALLNYFRETDTRYQTQLIGYDNKPSEWTANPIKEYTNLPQGRYTFTVWAKDYLGQISGPIKLSFRVRPAPWFSWWAFLIYVVTLLGAAIAFYQWRALSWRRQQEARLKYLRQLLESTRIINSQLDLATVLQNIAAESARLIDGEPGGIGLIKKDEVIFDRIWLNDHWEDEVISFRLGEGIVGLVAATGESYISNDPKTDEKVTFAEFFNRYFINGFIDVPIKDRTGKIVGVLDVRRRAGGPPIDGEKQQLIESFAHQAAVAIENANLYGTLEEKSLMIVESLREIEKLYANEQQVTRSLQQLNEMKSNFMAVTSHEMRTPLTVLKGSLEALLEGYFGGLTTSQQRRLDTCHRMTDRLISGLNDIMEMLKISERRFILKPSALDLNILIAQIVEELDTFLIQRKQRITIELSESLPLISADGEKLRLVILNLLQNAIKFTHDEGEIKIRLTPEPEHIHVIIEDRGIGIEAGEIERIFEKFYTSRDYANHSSGKFQFEARGAGLGLAIAKSYVEAHGGRIWAESAGKGHGSAFHLLLPIICHIEQSSIRADNEPVDQLIG